MVFSSYIFLFYFLPLALCVYLPAPVAVRPLLLLALSAVFYAWAAPWYLILIGWTAGVDYVCGNFIGGYWRLPGRSKTTSDLTLAGDLALAGGSVAAGGAARWQQKVFLTLSLASNIGLLCTFKYGVFLQENYNALSQFIGQPPVIVRSIVLPAGISFYVFESISYVVDIYRGHTLPAPAWPQLGDARGLRRHARAFTAFACYLVQFPHLVSGPIIRFQDLADQIFRPRVTVDRFAQGVFFFSLGLAKKVLIADLLGDVADAAFAASPLNVPQSWYGLYAYAFQIYFDFSGYTDMAVGLGLMLGFSYLINFDSPYRARSVTDFWRRWHISLSTWLRDYIYIPLGGNRTGASRTLLNLMVAMLVGGLWHGANWNFCLWGLMHGAALVTERVLRLSTRIGGLAGLLATAATFHFICLTWVPFRLAGLVDTVTYFGGMTGRWPGEAVRALPAGFGPTSGYPLVLLGAALICFLTPPTFRLAERITLPKAAGALVLLLAGVAALQIRAHHPFLYYQF